ncbi:MAG: glycosyltransferase family 9 protein [Chloroflexi bacterium]|nr:glycosyltransferase family 9 protein [Chloroflexota bacterium]
MTMLDFATTRRIAIFRALQLGDLLVAVPAFRAIRERFPCAEITLIGLPWAASFVRRYSHYIDRFVEFAGYPGIKEVAVDPERTSNFIAEQQHYGYDLVVQMHGNGHTSNLFALALNGKVTAGYYEDQPLAGLTLGAPYPHDQHEVLRNLGLAALLGCSNLNSGLEFPLFDAEYAEATALLRQLSRADRPWVGIHPGARPPARRWPAEYFAAVADDLVRHFDAQIILTGSPGEQPIVQGVIERMQQLPALNLAGKTSRGGLGALISNLDLFISNDTGPAHLAEAVNCSSITIFGPADYKRWAPLDQSRHPIVRRPVACSPCSYWDCPIDHRCLRWLKPSMVTNIAHDFLQEVTRSHETMHHM